MSKSTDKPVEESAVIQTPDVPTPAAPPNVDVSLTVSDLTTALQIISVVTNRGAIKAEEMEVVGKLYNKLKIFLDAAAAAEKKAAEALPAGNSPEDNAPTGDAEK